MNFDCRSIAYKELQNAYPPPKKNIDSPKKGISTQKKHPKDWNTSHKLKSIGLAKKFIQFFHDILWGNPNKLFGQPS